MQCGQRWECEMTDLQTLVENFAPVTYSRVQRNDQSYKETYDLATSELTRLISKYQTLTQVGQTARLIRDAIDHWIRRYHGYAIEGSIGAHYTQVGVDPTACVFEHVMPAAKVRDMLLQGVLTVKQALNTPTCLISAANDQILRDQGHVSSSPNYWYFFRRYETFDDAKFVTYNGQAINDLHSWTLADHFSFFNIEE
jgi:hypothetical protein